MVPHLFFYQFALIALVWLFFLLLYAWPSDRARRPPPAAPIAVLSDSTAGRLQGASASPAVGDHSQRWCLLSSDWVVHPNAADNSIGLKTR